MKCISEYDLTSEVGLIKDAKTLRFSHPKNNFVASIRRSDAPCQEDRRALRIWIEFDCDSLLVAKDVSDKYLASIMSALSYLTSGSVVMMKINRIIDWTPELYEREALYYHHSQANDAPFDILDSEIVNSLGSIFPHCEDDNLRQSMRWFRLALNQEINDDILYCFWRSIEILVPLFKDITKVNDLCPVCRSPLYCEKCESHTMHRPYPKQTMKEMVTREAQDDGSIFEKLNGIRNALAHGESLSTITSSDEESLDVTTLTGRLAFGLIFRALANKAGNIEVQGGIASMYAKAKVGFCAHLKSVFPADDDGLPEASSIHLSLERQESDEDTPLRKFRFRRTGDGE